MLPEVVWNMPRQGTINLHAFLPQYRGAAPINWAIINGEKKAASLPLSFNTISIPVISCSHNGFP
jgi:hypothetical protein